jgi:hypothetical protein
MSGSLNLWIYGSMELWIYGLWIDESMDEWMNRRIYCTDSMDSLNSMDSIDSLDSMVSRNSIDSTDLWTYRSTN